MLPVGTIHKKGERMKTVYCEKHYCSLAEAACASRYMNSQLTGASHVGNVTIGKFDPHCMVCQDGKSRAKRIGKDGVKEYRQSLIDIRRRAAAAIKRSSVPGAAFFELGRLA